MLLVHYLVFTRGHVDPTPTSTTGTSILHHHNQLVSHPLLQDAVQLELQQMSYEHIHVRIYYTCLHLLLAHSVCQTSTQLHTWQPLSTDGSSTDPSPNFLAPLNPTAITQLLEIAGAFLFYCAAILTTLLPLALLALPNLNILKPQHKPPPNYSISALSISMLSSTITLVKYILTTTATSPASWNLKLAPTLLASTSSDLTIATKQP